MKRNHNEELTKMLKELGQSVGAKINVDESWLKHDFRFDLRKNRLHHTELLKQMVKEMCKSIGIEITQIDTMLQHDLGHTPLFIHVH